MNFNLNNASTTGKPGDGKATTPLGADVKATDPKTTAPLASGKPVEKPIVREGSPQPEIKAPGLGHPLTADMRRRWANFADADLKNIHTRADLSAAVQSKYGITAGEAATQVKEWAVGRQF